MDNPEKQATFGNDSKYTIYKDEYVVSAMHKTERKGIIYYVRFHI
jgi:hypothetical protein